MAKRLPPIHPGEHLKKFIDDFGLTMSRLAKALHVSPNRVTAIVHGTRGITGETALRLSHYFGTSPEFWLNLQKHYELQIAQDEFEARIRKEVKPHESVAA